MTNCIREHRVARGLTQVALAKALSVSEWTIIRWEKGYNNIPLPELEKLARHLQVAPDVLVPGLACVPTQTSQAV
jgi:DNA-binding XRE family transcriptional regulator